MTDRLFLTLCLLPLAVFSLAFLALPLGRLFMGAVEGEAGWGVYAQILTTPRYLSTLVQTVVISAL
ncbi:MAG: ABC transporter permease, partial [Roseovarius sp.]